MDDSTNGKLIAFVSYNTWTMYNFRLEVLKSFLGKGYAVLIIAEEDGYAGQLVSLGCRFVPVSIKNRSLNPVDDLNLFFTLKEIYKTHRPDFIFHYVAKPNIYGTLAAGSLRIPSIAVITGLGHAFNKNNMLQVLIKKMYRFALNYASEVWCLNKDDAEFFIHHSMVSIQKLKVLTGEGVNTTYFRPDLYQRKKRRAVYFFTFSPVAEKQRDPRICGCSPDPEKKEL